MTRNDIVPIRVPRLALLIAAVCSATISQQQFTVYPAGRHGEDARGTAQGPGARDEPARGTAVLEEHLRAYIKHGNVAAGMPSFSDLA